MAGGVDEHIERGQAQMLPPQLLQSALDSASHGIAIVDARRGSYPVIYVNAAFESLSGWRAAEIIGSPCRLLLDVESGGEELERLRNALIHGRGTTVQLDHRRGRGPVRRSEVSLTPIRDSSGQLTHFLAVARSVDDLALPRQDPSQERPDTTLRFELDEAWRFRAADAAVVRLTRFDRAGLVGQSLWRAWPELLDTPFECTIVRALTESTHAEVVAWLPALARWFELSASPLEHGSLAVAMNDVTALFSRTLPDADTLLRDNLTGLPSRSHFLDRLRSLVSAAEHGERALAVLDIDIDGFAQINDSLGHRVGDDVLRRVASHLRAMATPGSLTARFGSDEFVLVLDEADEAKLLSIARQLVDAIGTPMTIDGRSLVVTACVGLAVWPLGGDQPDRLLVNAGLALDAAKAQGRGTVLRYDIEVARRERRRRTLMASLRESRLEEAFHVVYQPRFDVSAARIVGMEALLRWKHPELGSISPSEFIPLAESCGEILRLGQFVATQVCAQLRRWMDAGLEPVPVSVNFSVRQIEAEGCVECLGAVLAAAGVPGRLLQVEITESQLLSDPERAGEIVSALGSLGVAVLLDDFGTGHSSLSMLWRLPVRGVKIDPGFVAGLEDLEVCVPIVRGIVTLVRGLQREVVAEGVETDQQKALLLDLGCDQMQGFLFAHPLPAADAGRLLPRRPSSTAREN